jgi:NitT/TauT family transport system ATP-binding protein
MTEAEVALPQLQPAPESAVPVVQFTDVAKVYGEGARALTAVSNVNFTIPDHPNRGEFVAILGPSGCGKSTILRMIAGLKPQFPASRGEVRVFGEQVTGAAADRGMVFQDYTSFDHLSVRDNIAFGLALRGEPKPTRDELAMEWIGKVGLDPKRDAAKFPHELSGGMRQRVAIARTLILHPRIILMDEPFGALDPPTRLAMQDLLVSLWRERESTVFFITHSIEEAVYLGDRLLILSPSPGTILHDMSVPPPDRPANEMQREAGFMEEVFVVRDLLDDLEAQAQAQMEAQVQKETKAEGPA